ncbi:conserved exported hypothetical protein [Candidatus Sulfopaludibacter sp. SbA3]|nr:conserved exported hypothetical protein [Candidatus Sulfopaludibacter sp. SbA3]
MKIVSVGLLLAVLPAFGGQQGAMLAPIALYTQFQQEPPAGLLEAMRLELASIMAPMGLRFDWRSLNRSHSDDVSVELAVVTFKGRCEVSRLMPHVVAHSGPLGWTHVSEGAILPFADIDCDGVRNFLQNGLLGVRAQDRDEMLGRALGRVLAHELYHILANTQHHGSGGVGKAAYTVQNLLEGEFQFDEKESAALLTSKAHELLSLSGSDSSK